MAYSPGVLVGHDDFTGIAAGTALNGRVAPSGGTWATSGAATDFTAADGPNAGQESMSRATAADTGVGRLAVLGATNYADIEVGVTIQFPRGAGDPVMPGAEEEAVVQQGAVARYVDANNYLVTELYSHTDFTALRVMSVVAGVSTVVAQREVGRQTASKLRLVVMAGGGFTADLLTLGGGTIATVSGSRTELVAGGALATGKPGFRDYSSSSTATTRYYDDFYVAKPAPEPIALYAGRSIEFRHDSVLRQDATGTYAGPPPEYVGSRFFIPPAGDKGRKTRIAVVAKRNDVTTSPDDHIADTVTITVYATPRYLAVPR